jgi:hypothetical protein
MLKTLKKLFIGLVVLAIILLVEPKTASASGITAISDTMSRLQVSQNSSHQIKFTTQSAIQTTGDTITITFPSDFNFTSKNINTLTMTTGPSTGLENSQTIQAGAGTSIWGAVFSGTQNKILTLTSPTNGASATHPVNAGDKIIITYDSTNSVNGSSNTTYNVSIAVAGSATESGSLAVNLLTSDQISVTANVDPTITFSLDHTSTDFGTISATSVKTASPNITLQTSTNATSGYTISIQDQGSGSNPGLYNSISSYLLGSADASYNSTADLSSVAGYGIQATSATATLAARYNQTSNTVGGLARTAQTLASYNSVADSQQVTITSKAKVTGSSPAGSYADTITVIATANF